MENTSYPKLDPVFKAQWIAALRSGEYKQGKHRLFKDGAYCCLGVACKVSGLSDDDLKDYVYTGIIDVNHPGVLPQVLVKTFLNDVPHKLADMNDKGDKSFSQIADWIEANL